MVDTAGRLPTQLHLMEELKKIRRVIGKADAAAPHEVLGSTAIPARTRWPRSVPSTPPST